MLNTADILINAVLFIFLPLWAIAGFVDWCCHKASQIEVTTGIKENLMHCVMGIQIAIPMYLCISYRVNAFILIICFFCLILHEVIAHWDVHYAQNLRKITIWEMHAHSYLATLPFFLFVIILVINWHVVSEWMQSPTLINIELKPMETPHGGENYLSFYLIFLSIACIFPYVEEFFRCLKATKRDPK